MNRSRCFSAKPLAEFVNRYVSVKIVALAISLTVQALTRVATRKQAGT